MKLWMMTGTPTTSGTKAKAILVAPIVFVTTSSTLPNLYAGNVVVSSPIRITWTCTCKSIVLASFAAQYVEMCGSDRPRMLFSMSRVGVAADVWAETMRVGRFMITCRETRVGAILCWRMVEVIPIENRCPISLTNAKNAQRVFAIWVNWCNTWIKSTIGWECLGISRKSCIEPFGRCWSLSSSPSAF